MSRRMVALHGVAGAGKDSVAKVLVERYGWRRIAFADPVREMALAIDPWIPENHPDYNPWRLSELVEKYGWDYAKREYEEVRRVLQRVGTDAVRTQSPHYWRDLAQKNAARTPNQSIVFTDCRFPNEAGMVHAHGGFVVRINTDIGLTGENAKHASENAMANFDFDLEFDNPWTDDSAVVAQRMEHFAKVLAEDQQLGQSSTFRQMMMNLTP